jgi:hypothetical protein
VIGYLAQAEYDRRVRKAKPEEAVVGDAGAPGRWPPHHRTQAFEQAESRVCCASKSATGAITKRMTPIATCTRQAQRRRARVLAAFFAAADRAALPLVRAAFLAAAERLLAVRRRAADRA